jgi:hypothetical protein
LLIAGEFEAGEAFMQLHQAVLGAIVLTLGNLAPSAADAEPVVIPTVSLTAGSIIVPPRISGSPDVVLLGPSFSFVGTVNEPFAYVSSRACFPCAPGETTGPRAGFIGPADGRVTYGTNWWDADNPADYDYAGFELVGPRVVLPPLTAPGEIITLTSPFLFKGSLSLREESSPEPFLLATMEGRGTAEMTFKGYGYGSNLPNWIYHGVTYRFEPVPEPATLLLLAGGLAELTRRRLRAGRGR